MIRRKDLKIKKEKDFLYLKSKAKIIKYQHEMINNNIKSFLSAKKIDNNTLKYCIKDYVALDEFINFKDLKQKEFIKIIQNIIKIIEETKYYLLDNENILLDPSKVFIDLETFSIKLIYIPVNKKDTDYKKQFREIIKMLMFSIDDKEFFENNDINLIRNRINDSSCKLENILDDIKNVKNETILSKIIRKVKNLKIDNSKTQYIKRNNTLKLIVNGKEIPVNKRSFYIGKLKTHCDLCFKNDLISRVHGLIEKSGDKYYYKDLNSKNGSKLNGKNVKKLQRRKLNNKDRIQIINNVIEVVII